MKKLFSILAILILSMAGFGQTAPTWYYTADEVNPLAPTVGSGNINPFSSAYSIGNTGGIVGKYLTEPPFTDHVESNWPIPTSSFTWMGWIRPGWRFQLARNATLFNFCNMTASIQYPYMKFTTSTKPAGAAFSDEFFINFYGINKASWHNLFDGNWHHLTFVYNATTGLKQVWIDGQLPTGFSKTIPTGSINNGGTTVCYWADYNGQLNRYAGDIDEVAVWSNTAVTPSQIYNNYAVSLAGAHYTQAFQTVPAAQPVTGSLDPLDFMVGTTLPTGVGQQTSGVTISALAQLQDQPLGRYRYFATASDSFLPIFSFADPSYLGRQLQPGVSNAQTAINARDISLELALKHNWEYQLWQIGSGLLTGPTTYLGMSLAAKATYPQIKLGITTFRRQFNPFNTIPNDNSQPVYPASHYLQNSLGQAISNNTGAVTTNKRPRPSFDITQSLSAFPDSLVYRMGDSTKVALQRLYTAAANPAFNIFHICENGEDEERILNSPMDLDPTVTGWRIAAGVNQSTFQSIAVKRRSLAYSGRFIGTTLASDSCLFAEYQRQGNKDYFFEWTQSRLAYFIHRGMRLSTTDLYWRNPWEWLYGNLGAFHGLRWAMDNQPDELQTSHDIINSLFVSCGYDKNETKSMRPAQYLGLLKCLGVMGAETYYASVFSISPIVGENPDPNNYVGGMNMVEYAQANTTRFKETLFKGYLMLGDMAQHIDSSATGTRACWFNAGDYANYVVVRKDSAITSYVLGACMNPNTNSLGGCPVTDSCVISLASQTVKFMVRRQGSVYRYNNSVSPAIFYQIDGWHESSHPYRWTRDFYFHTANRDNPTAPPMKTYVPAGTAAGDYRTFLTAVSYADTATVFEANKYYFNPRVADSLYLWVRARVRTLGQTTGMVTTIDGSSTFTISGIADTNWFWYRRQGQVIIGYANVTAALHYFSFAASNKYLEVEQILLTHDANLVMPNNEGGCGTVVATITPSAPQSVCNGLTVTLTANSNSAYLWSTGATTQSIAAGSAGSYTVTVFDSFGCSGTSSPVVVSILALPSTPTITPTGATTFCQGGSVLLTSSSGTTYIWSTGATTQSISPTATGSYRVTVSNAAGCTASSALTVVTVNGNPVLASIPPVQNTCPAVDFDLSTIIITNTGVAGTTTYYANQADAIAATNAISSTVTVTGTYWIRVTTAASCFDYKSVGVVISNCSCVSPPTANAGPDQSICSGSTATMAGSIGGSATVGTWSTSGTGTFGSATVLNTVYTPSVADRTAGTVTITLTTNNPSGGTCVAASNQMILTINALPTATISASGPTTFCTGGSVNLVVTAGASYLWSNGATTQSATITTAGSYTCTVTSAAGCTASSNVIAVTENALPPTPTITPIGATTFCNGDSVLLASSSMTGNVWSTGATTQTIYTADAGTFIVTVTNVSGCSASSAGTAVVVKPTPNIPTITASQSPILCIGDSVTLTSSRLSGNLWSTGAATQSIMVHDAGSYVVTVTNASGCSRVSAATAVSYINCTVACRVPTQLQVTKIGPYAAILSIDPTNIATDYIIHLTNIRTNKLTRITVQGSSRTWRIKFLDPGTGYKWQVQAWCGDTIFTNFSVIKYFQTKSAGTLGNE